MLLIYIISGVTLLAIWVTLLYAIRKGDAAQDKLIAAIDAIIEKGKGV
jgi:hypothetical protein